MRIKLSGRRPSVGSGKQLHGCVRELSDMGRYPLLLLLGAIHCCCCLLLLVIFINEAKDAEKIRCLPTSSWMGGKRWILTKKKVKSGVSSGVELSCMLLYLLLL